MIQVSMISISQDGRFSFDGIADSWDDIDQFVRRAHNHMGTMFSRIDITLTASMPEISANGVLADTTFALSQFINGNHPSTPANALCA